MSRAPIDAEDCVAVRCHADGAGFLLHVVRADGGQFALSIATRAQLREILLELGQEGADARDLGEPVVLH